MQDALRLNSVDFSKEGITQNGLLDSLGFTINYRYRKGERDFLLVAFDGWDPERTYKASFSYSKWKYLKSIGCNLLYLSHPVFEGKRISHSIFTGLLNSLEGKNPIFHLIKSALSSLGVGTSGVIFYGGSSGGFSAIQYSLYFKNSKCCAINPETSLLAHDIDTINKYKYLIARSSGYNKVVTRLNLNNQVVKRNAGLPHLLIHQNLYDETYYNRHFMGFSELFRARVKETGSGSLMVKEYISDAGHSAEIHNSVLGTSLSMLMNFTKFSGVKIACLDRLLYKKMSSLKLKIFIEIDLNLENTISPDDIFLVFTSNDFRFEKEDIYKVPLHDLETEDGSFIWEGVLADDKNYIYLQSNMSDLSESIVNINEVIDI